MDSNQQTFQLDDGDGESEELAQLRGNYDASRIEAAKPKQYAVAVDLLAAGTIPARQISVATGLSFESIVAIRLKEAAAIRAGKRRVVAELDLILAFAREGLLEKAIAGKLGALEYGILTDKRELLNGGATERVEHVGESPEIAAFKELAARIQDQLTTPEPKTVPGMVLGAEKILAMADPVAPATAAAGSQSEDVPRDSESTD